MITPEDIQAAFIAIRSIRDLGIKLTVTENGNINCLWSQKMPQAIRDKLVRHKPGILRVLRGEQIAGLPVLRVEVRGNRPCNKRAVLVFTNESRPQLV